MLGLVIVYLQYTKIYRIILKFESINFKLQIQLI